MPRANDTALMLVRRDPSVANPQPPRGALTDGRIVRHHQQRHAFLAVQTLLARLGSLVVPLLVLIRPW